MCVSVEKQFFGGGLEILKLGILRNFDTNVNLEHSLIITHQAVVVVAIYLSSSHFIASTFPILAAEEGERSMCVPRYLLQKYCSGRACVPAMMVSIARGYQLLLFG